MSDKKDNRITKSATGYISKSYHAKLEGISKEKKVPLSRLVSIAIENELFKEDSFNLEITLPEVNENVDYAYADESGKLMKYMKELRGAMGLDLLVSLREDIGVPDKDKFLACFAECLHHEAIIEFKSLKLSKTHHRPEDYSYYKVKPLKGEETARKKRNKEQEYKEFLRLQKKFENEA